MNTYAFLIKAKAKSDKKSLFCWFSAKSDSRAERDIANLLEDAEIETGRGADYVLPVRTNWHVVDDLPAERVLDDTWCDRYELSDDGMSWRQIPKTESKSVSIQEEHAAASQKSTAETAIKHASFNQKVLAGWLFGVFSDDDLLTQNQLIEITALQHDMDATYVQNLLLALNNAKELLQLQHCYLETLFDLIDSIKSIWAPEGKAPDVGHLVTFSKEWIHAHNNQAISPNGPLREDITAKWIAKQGMKRTETGANAGGDKKTDRTGYTHTFDTLDIDIALATLPFDFDIYNLPGPVYRRAKEIIATREEPFKTWSSKLRAMPGILDVSRAGVIALVRCAALDITHFPDSMQRYINATLTAEYYAEPTSELLSLARHMPEVAAETNAQSVEISLEERQAREALSRSFDEFSRKTDAVFGIKTQPKIESLGDGKFSIDGLMAPASNEGEKTENHAEGTDNVQMEAVDSQSRETGVAISADEKTDAGNPLPETVEEAAAGLADAIKRWTSDIPPETSVPAEPQEPEVTTEYPAYFEPGRYEDLPNNVYHAANGISSTQLKDARVSLMYFNCRHVAKTIAREQSKVLDMGNLVHALALQPENLLAEFSIEPEIPQGAFTTTATIRTFIDEHNASLPPLLSSDDIKALLEAHNATLPAPVPLGASADETGQSYMALPAEYQRIEEGQKQTATAMKACIKEYNATLPAPMKTSGSRDTLLEQLAVINPDMVAQEAQKPVPLKVSGTKTDLIQAVKLVNPDAVFADELLDAWRANPEEKILVTRQQLATAQAIQSALFAHPTAGKLLKHPSRAVEVSYFGMDPETGLEVRVRPDVEIELDSLRIGADLKTISMWNVKREALRAKLHREIIERDYHLSAAMYCDVAFLDQFFWIFVNKDEGYHWIAVVEASSELLELGRLEYQATMRDVANAFDTDTWPAPITDGYTDELNDFDLRRLDALRVA